MDAPVNLSRLVVTAEANSETADKMNPLPHQT